MIKALDVDKSGHLDYQEFKNLSMLIVKERKKVKQKEREKKQMVLDMKRRQAAGMDVHEVKSSESSEPEEIDETAQVIQEAVGRSSVLAKDYEGDLRLFSSDSHRQIDSTPGASPLNARNNPGGGPLTPKGRPLSPRRSTMFHVPHQPTIHRGTNRGSMYDVPAPPLQLKEAEHIVRAQAKAAHHSHVPFIHRASSTSPTETGHLPGPLAYLMREHSGGSMSSKGESKGGSHRALQHPKLGMHPEHSRPAPVEDGGQLRRAVSHDESTLAQARQASMSAHRIPAA
eukprot:CAMPEP_0184329452 /NCGR_PEP_ID=MMETSP1049-20130417/144158_1 /TAXON_ID=77928 /ORGANISM="Proteomonas sulcata, Strain CCMP704" /LENGTH=284 /DNA_ID=CAMNT_0026651821 /DNA_START=18 /DNA_END=872 /DNA_ORIENTATION=+